MSSGGANGSRARGFALRSLVIALLILLAPLAAAEGPRAEVRTLTADGSCSQSSVGWYDSGSYYIPGPPTGNNTTPPDPNGTPPPPQPAPGGFGGWSNSGYSTQSRCENESDVATVSASDDAGRLGGASVGAWNETRDGRSESSSYSYFYGDDGSSWGSGRSAYGQSFERDAARGVKADALGANASATSGCQDEHAYSREWSSSWSQNAWGQSASSHDAYADSGRHACGDTLAAGAAGHGVSAGNTTSCASTYRGDAQSSSSSWNDNSSSGYGYRDTSDHMTYGCREGALATADGEEAFAGSSYRCQGDASSWQSWSDNGGNASYSNSNATRETCFSGLGASGPDGIHAEAGQESTTQGACWSSNGGSDCDGSQWSQSVIRWGWASSPLEPLAAGEVGLPLP